MSKDDIVDQPISIPTSKSKIQPTEETVWNNHDNQEFYESLTAKGLKEFAEKGGLASGCDLDILTPYWSKAKSILEVGAGYGRVVKYLLEHGFTGKITAIERCNILFDYLTKQFHSYANVDLIQEDIHNCDRITEKFDLILFLWSGLADFSKTEQLFIIEKLKKLLNNTGIIIIDTMPMNVRPLQAEQFGSQSFCTSIKNHTVYTYEPTIEEIKNYAAKNELNIVRLLICRTDINRERWLYVLN